MGLEARTVNYRDYETRPDGASRAIGAPFSRWRAGYLQGFRDPFIGSARSARFGMVTP